ncbi:starch-binding protein [Bacteroidia bacterium]|nr:starch-binding protein [Bacteroidia bacterium]
MKNKRMKIKKNILLLSAAALLTSACEDFLAPEAPSSFYPDYVFSNTDDAKKALLGVYALFATDDYTSRMSNVWMQNTDVEASQPDANPGSDRRTIWSLQGGILTTWGEMDQRWQNNYLAIDRANQCIEGMLASDAKAHPDMKMMIAEAYCLRAYRYFLLCNFWGDVPYFREAAKYGQELDRPKTDKNIIYSGMIQDLVNSEADMYYMDEFADGVERMNRDFALGMIARLSLFRAGYGMTKEGVMKRADEYLNVATNEDLAVTYTIGGQTKTARTSTEYYELAKVYCQKLIAERPKTLASDFAKIFRDECEQVINSNGEVLYEVAFGTGTTNSRGDVGWTIGVPVLGGTKGTTTIQVLFAPPYYYSFDPKDIRRDVTCSKISYVSDMEQRVSDPRTLSVGKWNRLWMKNDQADGSSKSTGINWPLMRYSDILLMLAEADNEITGGPTALAKDMLKTVRQRAFNAADHSTKVDAYVNALTSKADFFNAIVDERAWEFGGECLRKFDLVRWNIYGKKIVETKRIINNMGKAAYGLNISDPEVSKYANLADVIYYKRMGGTVEFVNAPDKKITDPSGGTAITESDANGYVNGADSYAKKDWTKTLYKETTAEPADYTQWSWRGYKDETGNSAVPYLLPIGTSTLSSSTVLNNDGYGHVFTN